MDSIGNFEYNKKDLIGHGAFAIVYKGRQKTVFIFLYIFLFEKVTNIVLIVIASATRSCHKSNNKKEFRQIAKPFGQRD